MIPLLRVKIKKEEKKKRYTYLTLFIADGLGKYITDSKMFRNLEPKSSFSTPEVIFILSGQRGHVFSFSR